MKFAVLSSEGKEEVDVSKLVDKLLCLYHEYTTTYNQQPKYLKIPLWVYYVLQKHQETLLGYKDGETIAKFLGLIVCETVSITEIDEIEIF